MQHETAVITTLTQQQVDDLLYWCEESKENLRQRNRVIVLLTVDAGLTVSEIARLKREHIMKDNKNCREIRVVGKKARTIPMSERLFIAILEMQIGLPGDLDSPVIAPEKWQDELRHRHFIPSSIAYVLYKLFKKAGIDASSFVGRRTFVVEAMNHAPLTGAAPCDIQVIAGLSGQSLDRYGNRYENANVGSGKIPFRGQRANRLRQAALVEKVAQRA